MTLSWKLTSLLVVCALAAAGSPALASVVQTFDLGRENFQAWTVNDSGDSALLSPTWHASGGSGGGGYISSPINASSNRLYDLQPADARAFGDITGLVLTADTKLQGSIDAPAGAMVRFYVGSSAAGSYYFVSTDAFSWDPNADRAWTTHQVALIAQNFARWTNSDTGTMTFQQVLSQVDDIGIVFTSSLGSIGDNSSLGFSSRNGATFNLDNFGTVGSYSSNVPEPTTLSLLAFGALLLRRRRDRR